MQGWSMKVWCPITCQFTTTGQHCSTAEASEASFTMPTAPGSSVRSMLHGRRFQPFRRRTRRLRRRQQRRQRPRPWPRRRANASGAIAPSSPKSNWRSWSKPSARRITPMCCSVNNWRSPSTSKKSESRSFFNYFHQFIYGLSMVYPWFIHPMDPFHIHSPFSILILCLSTVVGYSNRFDIQLKPIGIKVATWVPWAH